MQNKTYLGRYLITHGQYGQPIRLQREGSAKIYKAFDSQSNREVALEVVPAGTLRLSVQERLKGEAEAAQRLQQINIPMLYDFGIEDNEFIYASEMVEGVTAEQWVTTHGPMPVGSALRIAAQVTNAIGAATFHGINHHALNPSNVMIVPGQTAEGEWPLIKVIQFVGLAPQHSRHDASAAGLTDAVNFVAPEQLESGVADFASQIYGLGCTLWFLLSGVPPLAGAATVESATSVPAPVRQLIARMLALDPRDRPLDPVALHGAIEDCIAEVENKRVTVPASASVAPAPVVMMDPRPRRPFPWQALAVAAVLLMLGGIVAVFLPRQASGPDKLGVQIGVPENVAARAAQTVQPAQDVPLSSMEQAAQITSTPGVLYSNAGSTQDEPEAEPAASIKAVSDTPVQVASNEPVASPIATPATVAQLEPEPPSEGPPETAVVQSPNESVVTYATPEPVESTPAPPPVRIVKQEPKPAVVARPASAKRETPVASSSRRLRNGNVRAQYLGTTPEGELIFGLPNDERGFVSAGGRRSAQQRRLPVRKAEPPDGLPVLPALPADQ